MASIGVLLHAIQILMNQFTFEFRLIVVLVTKHPLFFLRITEAEMPFKTKCIQHLQ